MTTITVNITEQGGITPLGSIAHLAFLPVKIACEVECAEDDCFDCGTPFNYIAREGDVLHFQFRFPDFFNTDIEEPEYGWQYDNIAPWWLTADIMNADGTVALANITLNTAFDDNGVRAGFAVGFDGQSYQNLAINVNSALIEALNGECFYVRVNACSLVLDNDYIVVQGMGTLPAWQNFRPDDLWIDENGVLYIVTVAGWAVVTPQPDEGTIAWVVEMGQYIELTDEGWNVTETSIGFTPTECGATRTCSTPQFTLSSCNKVLCFEAKPTRDRDCGNKYFGDEGMDAWLENTSIAVGDYVYKERFCIEGDIELVGYDVTRTTTSRGRVTEEKSAAIYRLRAFVPARVAERMKNAMLPQNFTINGQTFDTVGGISKDNDESNDWHIDIELRTEDCDNVGGCL